MYTCVHVCLPAVKRSLTCLESFSLRWASLRVKMAKSFWIFAFSCSSLPSCLLISSLFSRRSSIPKEKGKKEGRKENNNVWNATQKMEHTQRERERERESKGQFLKASSRKKYGYQHYANRSRRLTFDKFVVVVLKLSTLWSHVCFSSCSVLCVGVVVKVIQL